jgi:hypothetical protein
MRPVADCCGNLIPGIAPPVIEYATDTRRAIGQLVFGGEAQRHPGTSWIFSHAGGTMPFLHHCFAGRAKEPGAVPGAMEQPLHFYYDTAQASTAPPLAALASLDRSVSAKRWAMVKGSLGCAFVLLGVNLASDEAIKAFQHAIVLLEEAREVDRRDEDPMRWATHSFNLVSLGDRLKDMELVQSAIDHLGVVITTYEQIGAEARVRHVMAYRDAVQAVEQNRFWFDQLFLNMLPRQVEAGEIFTKGGRHRSVMSGATRTRRLIAIESGAVLAVRIKTQVNSTVNTQAS